MKRITLRDTIAIMPDLPLSQLIIIAYIVALVVGIVILSLYAQRQSKELKDLKKALDSESSHLAVMRQELHYTQKRLEDSRKTGDAETVLNQIRDAVLFINTQGSVTVLTPQAETLLAADKLSVVLKHYRESLALRDPEGNDITDLIERSLAGEPVVFPVFSILKRKDGMVPVTGSSTPVKTPEGNTEFAVVFLHDATREYAEMSDRDTEIATLRSSVAEMKNRIENEQAYSNISKRLVSEMKTGIIGLTSDQSVNLMNKHAEQYTGMLSDSVIGKQFRHVFRLTNAKDEEDFDAIEKALRGEVVPLPKWTFFTRKGGKGAISGTVIPASDTGQSRGAIIVFHDAMKEYEEETEEKAFFSGAAHDLRAPLTTIRSVIELLYDSFGTMPADQAKEILGGARDSVIHLIALVNDLLNVSRIEMGRIVISQEVFDIAALTNEALSSQEVAAKGKHLYITHEITDIELPKVKGDKTKAQEVIINLLSNAIKYTQQGGITVKHEFRDGKVVTSVTDTGLGIAPENQRLLFRKFQQVGQSRYQPMTKSTGLGLYIAKKFATLMGGNVELTESTIGRGSTFAFWLPAHMA